MSIVENALKKLQATAGTSARRVEKASSSAAATAPGPETNAPREASARPLVATSGKSIVIDTDALRFAGMMPPAHQERELGHQYRSLKRPLIKHAFDPSVARSPSGPSPRSIMVSSALPGEGKTFTSINLAMSLSLEKDHSVLLIDGDAPKPRLSHTLGIQKEPGLLDALVDPSIAVESLVLATNIPGLSVLPVGLRTDSATELMASARMRQIVQVLEQLDPNGIVLLDSSPILLTSEARVLSTVFGQVVLVVRAGGTPQQAVKDALTMIGDASRIGIVLNQAIHEDVGSYYGYSSYYGSSGTSDTASRAAGEP
jgi:protein-tyrosine kinase